MLVLLSPKGQSIRAGAALQHLELSPFGLHDKLTALTLLTLLNFFAV